MTAVLSPSILMESPMDTFFLSRSGADSKKQLGKETGGRTETKGGTAEPCRHDSPAESGIAGNACGRRTG